MSYILEALQKSEHARHRGKVPDLNTVPETTPSVPGHPATHRPPYLAAGFALAMAAAVLGWWRPWQAPESHATAPTPTATAGDELRQTAAPAQASREVQAEAGQTAAPTAVTAPAAAPAAAAPQPASPVASVATAAPAAPPALEPLAPARPPAVAPEPPKPVAPVATIRPEPPAPEPAASTGEIAPVRRSETAARKSAGYARPAQPPSPPASAAADPAPAPNRKGSDGRILNIHELPAAVRGSLPRLSISGFAAAPDSGKRMVVINDRLVQEGEEVVPGVTLTSAEKDGVVLDYQGYRFRAQQ